MSFINTGDVKWEHLEWGDLGWVVHPGTEPAANNLTLLDVVIEPGNGHAFHKHPNQQEAIYVVEGEVEQWLEESHRVISVGDAVFIPADTVHASFVAADAPTAAHLVVVLGPSYGDAGYETVDVTSEPRWAGLR